MEVTKTVQVESQELVELVCDRCGNRYDVRTDEGAAESHEFLRLSFTGRYASVFGDGTVVEADICQHCLKEWIGTVCRRS